MRSIHVKLLVKCNARTIERYMILLLLSRRNFNALLMTAHDAIDPPPRFQDMASRSMANPVQDHIALRSASRCLISIKRGEFMVLLGDSDTRLDFYCTSMSSNLNSKHVMCAHAMYNIIHVVCIYIMYNIIHTINPILCV